MHVSSVEGKLTANDLAKTLHGYFHRPLPQSVSEEQALARLIVGYKSVNMGELVSIRVDKVMDAHRV